MQSKDSLWALLIRVTYVLMRPYILLMPYVLFTGLHSQLQFWQASFINLRSINTRTGHLQATSSYAQI